MPSQRSDATGEMLLCGPDAGSHQPRHLGLGQVSNKAKNDCLSLPRWESRDCALQLITGNNGSFLRWRLARAERQPAPPAVAP